MRPHFMQHLFMSLVAIRDTLAARGVLKRNPLAKMSKLGIDPDHPALPMLEEAERLIETPAGPPLDLRPYPSISLLLDLGTHLSWTANLKGFEDQVGRRLRQPSEYEPAFHELRVARRHAEKSQDVRFIDGPAKARRGADIGIFSSRGMVHVEAKYKNRIAVGAPDPVTAPMVKSLCAGLLKELSLGLDIGCLVFGDADEERYRTAIDIIRSRVLGGFRGFDYDRKAELFVSVNDRPAVISSSQTFSTGLPFPITASRTQASESGNEQ